jgi:hypothetical protein
VLPCVVGSYEYLLEYIFCSFPFFRRGVKVYCFNVFAIFLTPLSFKYVLSYRSALDILVCWI